MPDEDKILLTTLTGEPYQLARVYYQVFNKKTVIGAFNKLRCMKFEPPGNRWVWLYEAEAKKLRFDNSHHKIPKDMRPVVIGYFVFRGDREMLLELRSFERLTKAIDFFDKRINRRAAKVRKLRVVNKIFSAPEDPREVERRPTPDAFFDREDVYIPNPQEFEEQLKSISAENEDEESKQEALFAYLEAKANQPLPEVEELRPNFYEDGIFSLEFSLRMRQREAFEHWQGNKNFSQGDLIREIVGSTADDRWEEDEQ